MVLLVKMVKPLWENNMTPMNFIVKSWEYNDTGILVKPGQVISVVAKTGATWLDLTTLCDADGWNSSNFIYNLKFVKNSKDFPDENFMMLGARIGSDLYAVGKSKTFTAKQSGKLELFANDVSWMRWNNSGGISVEIILK